MPERSLVEESRVTGNEGSFFVDRRKLGHIAGNDTSEYREYRRIRTLHRTDIGVLVSPGNPFPLSAIGVAA